MLMCREKVLLSHNIRVGSAFHIGTDGIPFIDHLRYTCKFPKAIYTVSYSTTWENRQQEKVGDKNTVSPAMLEGAACIRK